MCDRGWFPYNCSIITLPHFRNTMTNEEIEAENTNASPDIELPISAKMDIIQLDEDLLTLDTKFLNSNNDIPKEKLNFSQGMSAYCALNIIQESDKYDAQKRIKEDRDKR